jgi:phosphoribosylamine---glycine ligase
MIPILSVLMRILVIGGGGREHAIGWKLAKHGHQVFAAPGNPGLADVGTVLSTTNYADAAESVNPDLTVVGPEMPLVAGVVDQFRARGLAIVGPDRQQAQLEGSKIYSKQFMADAHIPTARSVQVRDLEAARAALDSFMLPVVVKADGLAAGKGVVIAETREQAVAAIESLGPSLIIEEFLIGEEISFIAICDGRKALPFEATQDHKAVCNNDSGPNTGGMGAYCDGRLIDAGMAATVMDTIIRPVVDRTGFTGFLYAGLMMTADGPKVLEFNVRLGDPETQPLMHRMRTDFAEVLTAAARGDLGSCRFDWRPEPSVCVVIAAAGYPGKVRTGDTISGVDSCGTEVFQAGTRIGSRGLETAGGRVLGVTDRGADLRQAIETTYRAASLVHFEGMHFRSDIGRKGLKRW